MYINLKKNSKSKKIQIFSEMFHDFELKIEFSYKYCQNIICD